MLIARRAENAGTGGSGFAVGSDGVAVAEVDLVDDGVVEGLLVEVLVGLTLATPDGMLDDVTPPGPSATSPEQAATTSAPAQTPTETLYRLMPRP